MKNDRKKVGRFVICTNQLLGIGAFSHTYKAYLGQQHSQIYACKVVNKQEMKQNGLNIGYLIVRLKSQLQTLRQLKHENIVQFKDFEQTHNNLYFFMQYCSQGTLQNYIKNNPYGIDQQKILYFTKQILKAFNFISNKNIIHRDVKPSNILLKQNCIKIADFGMAKIIQDTVSKQSFSTNLGTAHYKAPEIIKQVKRQQTTKCDVWSAGVTLYQLATGELPFNMTKKMEGQNKILQTIQNKCDWSKIQNQNLQALLQKMLVVDVNYRINFKQAYMMICKNVI